MKQTPLAAGIAIAMWSWAALADNQLQPVLVEDTELKEPAVEQAAPEEIAPAMPADGGEMLRQIPGVSGVRMGGHGIDPIIRGQSQTRLNVLLDGAFVHGGCPNRMDPPTAYSPTETYDEVTVIKGSQTVVYGSGGSGGTVLFERVTPRLSVDEDYRAEVGAGYKANSDTKEISADVTAGNPDFFARGIATYKDAGNYTDGAGNEVRSSYTEKGATALFGYTPDDDTRVEFSAEAMRERDALFAGAGMDSPISDADTYRLKLERDRAVGPFAGVQAEVYVSNVDHLMDNYSLRTNTMMWKKTPATSDTTGGRVSGDIASGEVLWTIGADTQNNDRDAERLRAMAGMDPNMVEAILWPGTALDQAGLFAEMMVPVSEQGMLKAGLRYDRVEAEVTRADEAFDVVQTHPLTGSPTTSNELYQAVYTDVSNSASEDNVAGFVRYEHAIADGQGTVSIGVSRAVRTADASERYIASRMVMSGMDMSWVGNTNLAPEKHHQIEVGLTFAEANWSVAGSVYYNKVDDFILQDKARGQAGIIATVPSSVTIYRNVDATLYGFELSGDYRWSSQWQGRASLAYVRGKNDTDGGRAIAQIPPLDLTIGLDYETKRWGLGGQLRANLTQTEADLVNGSGQDVQETPGWAVLDLSGQYQASKQATIRFGVDNLFDKEYAYHVNRANQDPFNPEAIQVNEPGRTLWARLEASF